ncbi:MAG: hypothetical protein OHK0052_10720 [Anaerolineales bacterium]
MTLHLRILLLFGLLTSLLVPAATPAPARFDWREKVDPWVLQTTENGTSTEFLVFLTQQADLSAAAALPTRAEKGAFVYTQLSQTAARTQAPLLTELKRLGVEHRPYWIVNMLWVRGNAALVQRLAARADVAHIYANPSVPLHLPETPPPATPAAPAGVEWNITKVNAPDLWALGITGEGVVIGGQDTGYQWNHPALRAAYRGWNGLTANHNYSWHDAIHSGGGSCGADSTVPCDDYGHGTHTMGTMVGDDGGANQIGMAPGARWIGCRNMNVGNGTPATYSECFQWFIAPTDLNDENPRPDLAPDVINNSWGCTVSEGCSDPTLLQMVVENTRAAGIFVVASAGNSGPGCSSVAEPPAIYTAAFTVGSTTSSDAISSFSSRGPVTIDGSGRMKPDISAPGSSVRSSTPGNAYGVSSGTSMAGPHVAGLTALLISAFPTLRGQHETIAELITQSAVALTSTQTCGGIPGSQIPNNTFGWGRIDALAAYNLAQSQQPTEILLHKTASAAQIAPGSLLTYTLTVTNPHEFTAQTALLLTDTLPAQTTFIRATAPYSLTGNQIAWARPALAAGEVWQTQLTVQVQPNAQGSLSNDDYAVRSTEAQARGAAVTTEIVPFALGIALNGAQNLAPGDLLTYTLSVTNLHPFGTLHNLVLTDVLPINSQIVTAALPYTQTGAQIAWYLPELPSGAVWTRTLTVRAPQPGVLANEFYGVQAAEHGALIGNPHYASVGALAVGFPVSQEIFAGADGILTFTLSLTNTGDYTHTFNLSVEISPSLPITLPAQITLNPNGVYTLNLTAALPPTAPNSTRWDGVLIVQAHHFPQWVWRVPFTLIRRDEPPIYWLYLPFVLR